MNIDPIHSGPVALAQALARANRGAARRKRDRRPFWRIAQWLRHLNPIDPVAHPGQMMLWSEYSGRSYATARIVTASLTSIRASDS